jgi:hypothetical protein
LADDAVAGGGKKVKEVKELREMPDAPVFAVVPEVFSYV